MAPVAGTHYLAGPVIAFAVVAGLALFLRWAFRSDPRRRPPADDGLLTRVATLSRHESALALRAVLSDAGDRKSTRLNSSHANISYAVFCLKKKKTLSHIHVVI